MKYLLIKDKKGFELKSAFFAIILISMTIIALQVWTEEWAIDYDSGIEYDLGGYNSLDSMTNQASKQEGNISGTDPGTSGDFEGTALRSVFGIINNIYTPFRVVFGRDGWISSITQRLGLPDYIWQGIVTMMIMAVTMTLIAILFRLSRSSA